MKIISYLTLCSLIVTLLLYKAAARQCPTNSSKWRDLGGDICYIIVENQKVPWIDAVYNCYVEGGSLASFHSSDEVLRVADQIIDRNIGLHIGLWKHYDGSLEWVDKSVIDFRNWNYGEPNFDYEQCVELYSSSGKWNDISCATERGYICSSPKFASSQLNTESRKICTDNSNHWRDFGGESCYIVEKVRKLTWQNALERCTVEGGSLASFHSLEEISAVLQRTKNIDKWFHIGLRQNENGIYKWSDRSRVDLDYWKSGPSNNEKLCGQMSTQSGRWSDVNCEKHSGYICSSVKDFCGRDIHSDRGTIQTPVFQGNYRPNENCTWYITVSEDYRVALKFHSLAVEQGNACKYDYVEVLDGLDSNSTVLGKFCDAETTRIPVIRSTTNKMAVKFVSDESHEGRGFFAEFIKARYCEEDIVAESGVIESPRNANNLYEPGEECIWRITVPENYQVLLKFQRLDVQGHPGCTVDAVQVLDGHNFTSPVLGRFCNSNARRSLRSSGNKMTVIFTSDFHSENYGFSAQFEKDICGGYVFSERDVLSSPNYPLNYRENEFCTWKISVPENYIVALQFHSFDLEENACLYDFVEIRDGHETDSALLGKFCGKDVPDMIRSSTNNITVKFISDSSYQGSGFNATYIKAHLCGEEELVAENGILQTPNYPDNYRPGEKCVWKIIVPTNQRIFLKFATFEVEDSANCSADFLEIYDGTESGSILRRFCGSGAPGIVMSTGNKMTIVFSSDVSNENTGFSAEFKGMPRGKMLEYEINQIPNILLKKFVPSVKKNVLQRQWGNL